MTTQIFSMAIVLGLLISGCSRKQAPPQTVRSSSEGANVSPATPRVSSQEVRVPDDTGFSATVSSLPLSLPSPPVRPAANDPRIAAIKQKLDKYPTFAGYTSLAAVYVELGMMQEAAETHRIEAALYRKKGLPDAAIIKANAAARYETSVQVFVTRRPRKAESRRLFTGATLEPKAGCYTGAFIDNNDQLREKFTGDNFRGHHHPSEFADLVGRQQASVFTYVGYGEKFPVKWLNICKAERVIPHIAWEPKDLGAVQDDDYLQSCAKALRELNWPVFIRFAGEMNGSWTPYHGNPALYREKFRLVHKVLHRHAPKVATIWCVNSVPSNTISDYYPGDSGCDWVGVNLYSAPFYDNDVNREAFRDSPLTLLDPVYRAYSKRKPIAICEYAASHMAAADRVVRTDFAVGKMSLLYSALPLLYPRVKMVNWFDCDNLTHARPGRQLNNYSLTEQPEILGAYQELTNNPYFTAPSAPGGTAVQELPFPVERGQALPREARLSVWVKTYVEQPTVLLKIGSRLVYAGQEYGAHDVNLDMTSLPPGRQNLTVYVYDDNDRFVSSSTTSILNSPA